jgi:hypothetical protein
MICDKWWRVQEKNQSLHEGGQVLAVFLADSSPNSVDMLIEEGVGLD